MKNKKLIIIVILVIACGSFFALISALGGGNVDDVKETVVSTDTYSEDDIKTAMNVVKKKFKREFKGSTLTHLWNDKKIENSTMQSWAKQYNANEAIIIFSNFDVDASGGDGSLNPNSTYSWQWVLVRNSAKDSWILKTWGY